MVQGVKGNHAPYTIWCDSGVCRQSYTGEKWQRRGETRNAARQVGWTAEVVRSNQNLSGSAMNLVLDGCPAHPRKGKVWRK